MLTRLPVFLLGMLVGKYMYENREVEINTLMILTLGLLGLLTCDLVREVPLVSIIRVRLVYAVSVLPICFLVAYICEKTNQSMVTNTLNYFGKRSFEFYLVSTPLMKEMSKRDL